MKGFVLDSSVAISWCLDDEDQTHTDTLFRALQAKTATAYVPALWIWEINNSINVAIRRSRIDTTLARKRREELQSLAIEIDNVCANAVWTETSMLAMAHKLTVYDAAYLELALRLGLPLASLDSDLRKGAEKLKVKILPAKLY